MRGPQLGQRLACFKIQSFSFLHVVVGPRIGLHTRHILEFCWIGWVRSILTIGGFNFLVIQFAFVQELLGLVWADTSLETKGVVFLDGKDKVEVVPVVVVAV